MTLTMTHLTSPTVQLERTIRASAERLFALWTTPSLLQRWWGVSEGEELVVCDLDLRVGGRYRYGMQPRGSTGLQVACGVFQAVEPNRRLVFTWDWEGSDEVRHTLVTVEFIALAADLTKVIVTHERQPSRRVAEIHRQGWTYMLDDLERAAGSGTPSA